MVKERNYLNTRWKVSLMHHRAQAEHYLRLYLVLLFVIGVGWVLVIAQVALPDTTTPLTTVLTAGMVGAANLFFAALRPGERWRHHESRADCLERERALYESGIGPYTGADAFNRFVARCENLPSDTPASATSLPNLPNPPSPPRPFGPRPYRPFGPAASRFGGFEPDNRENSDDDDDDDDDETWEDDERLVGKLPFRQRSAPPAGDHRRAESLPLASISNGPAFSFTAYSPAETEPGIWRPLIAYAYPRIAADAVIADITGRRPPPAPTYQSPHRTIPEGARVTVVPRLDGFQFNPPAVTLGFYRRWHRFNFELRAVSAPVETAVNGALYFLVDGVVVAHLPLSVYVSASAEHNTALRRTSRSAYSSLLACYSATDRQVDSALQRVCTALEIDCRRVPPDAANGSHAATDPADACQVFWSQASAGHDPRPALADPATPLHVVYWQQPCPPLPEWLGHVQPLFEPVLAETTG